MPFSRSCSALGSSAMTRAISSSASRNGLGMPAIGRSTSVANADVPRGARPPIGVTGASAALRHGARILAAMAVDPVRPIEPWAPDVALAPGPDPDREPEGFVVAADDGSRLHFLDWGAPSDDDGPGVLLVPGLLQPASSWAPVARRLARARRTVVADLRGQGLSDSPMTGYDLATLAVGRRRGRGGFGRCWPAAGSCRGARVRGDRRARRGGGPGRTVCGRRARGRRLGAPRGHHGRGRRRVPARPRRAARGAAVLRRLPRRSPRLRPRRRGTPTRSGRRATPSSRPPPGTWSGRSGRTSSRRSCTRCSGGTRPGLSRTSRRRSRRSSRSGAGDAGRAPGGAAAHGGRAGGRGVRARSASTGFPGVAHNLMRYRPADVSAAILEIA